MKGAEVGRTVLGGTVVSACPYDMECSDRQRPNSTGFEMPTKGDAGAVGIQTRRAWAVPVGCGMRKPGDMRGEYIFLG